jgi:hypothetical protein
LVVAAIIWILWRRQKRVLKPGKATNREIDDYSSLHPTSTRSARSESPLIMRQSHVFNLSPSTSSGFSSSMGDVASRPVSPPRKGREHRHLPISVPYQDPEVGGNSQVSLDNHFSAHDIVHAVREETGSPPLATARAVISRPDPNQPTENYNVLLEAYAHLQRRVDDIEARDTPPAY